MSGSAVHRENPRGHWWQRRSRRLLAQVVILTAASSIYSGVLLIRIGGFALTLAHVTFALTAVAAIFILRRVNTRFAPVVYGMVLLELIHALFFGLSSELEWMKSVAQYAVYLIAFLTIAALKLDHTDLAAIFPWVRKTAVAFGGLGVIQFILLNSGMPALLPRSLSVRIYNPFDSARTGGFVPTIGAATEPSHYAGGLLVLLALLLFLDSNTNRKGKNPSYFAILIVLAGVLVSFSMVGILTASALVCAHLLSSRPTDRSVYFLVSATMLILIFATGLAAPVQTRLLRILHGGDQSATIRVEAAVRLLFAPANDFETSLLGTGLGLETRDAASYHSIYDEVSVRDRISNEIRIHNLLAVVRYFQGWTGVALYGALVWRMLYVPYGRWRKFFVPFIYFVALHFSTGLYLSPGTWAIFGLMTIMRRAQLFSSD